MNRTMLFGVALFGLIFAANSAEAQVHVEVGIPLPPLIVFPAPPQVVVLPGSDVYVVPDVAEDVYFYEGWWWRPWGGYWYRSSYYDGGWGYYPSVPVFYVGVPQNWRHEYRKHQWKGRPWNYERVTHQQVQKNWSNWKKDKHWEKSQSLKGRGAKPQQKPQDRVKAPRPHAAPPPRAQEPRAQQPRAQQPRAQGQHPSRPQVQGQQPNNPQGQQKGKVVKKGKKGKKGRR